MAKIYDKAGEKVLILGTREGLLFPFTAASWTDLRLCAWLSIVQTAADDDVTALAEALTVTTSRDRFWFGFKDSSSNFPLTAGSEWAGFSGGSASNTISANGTRWAMATTVVQIANGVTSLASTSFGNPNFPNATAAGYSMAFETRITRSTSASLTITPGVTSDLTNFSSTPTIASLRTQINTFGTSLTTASASTMTAAPTCIFIYWPFNNSRLRIHALALEKFAP